MILLAQATLSGQRRRRGGWPASVATRSSPRRSPSSSSRWRPPASTGRRWRPGGREALPHAAPGAPPEEGGRRRRRRRRGPRPGGGPPAPGQAAEPDAPSQNILKLRAASFRAQWSASRAEPLLPRSSPARPVPAAVGARPGADRLGQAELGAFLELLRGQARAPVGSLPRGDSSAGVLTTVRVREPRHPWGSPSRSTWRQAWEKVVRPTARRLLLRAQRPLRLGAGAAGLRRRAPLGQGVAQAHAELGTGLRSPGTARARSTAVTTWSTWATATRSDAVATPSRSGARRERRVPALPDGGELQLEHSIGAGALAPAVPGVAPAADAVRVRGDVPLAPDQPRLALHQPHRLHRRPALGSEHGDRAIPDGDPRRRTPSGTATASQDEWLDELRTRFGVKGPLGPRAAEGSAVSAGSLRTPPATGRGAMRPAWARSSSSRVVAFLEREHVRRRHRAASEAVGDRVDRPVERLRAPRRLSEEPQLRLDDLVQLLGRDAGQPDRDAAAARARAAPARAR